MPIFRHIQRAHDCDLSCDEYIIFSTAHDRQYAATGIWDHFPGDLNAERVIFCTPHVRQNAKAYEWRETPEAHVLRAETPGFKKDEVKVEVEESEYLKISCEKKVEREEKHENWHEFGSSRGQVLKTFRLPENCRPADRIWFSMEDGVIRVTVPKK